MRCRKGWSWFNVNENEGPVMCQSISTKTLSHGHCDRFTNWHVAKTNNENTISVTMVGVLGACELIVAIISLLMFFISAKTLLHRCYD